jgi:iron complex transport system permease protein
MTPAALVRSHPFFSAVLGCFFLLILVFFCASIGTDVTIRAWDLGLWRQFLSGESSRETIILFSIRLPRVFLGLVVGLCLSVSGLIFQSLLRNPLADPFIIGVSGGCGLTAVFLQVLHVHDPFLLILGSFVGGLLTILAVEKTASQSGILNRYVLVLTGVMFNAFFSALITFLLLYSAADMPRIFYWLLGSLNLPSFQTLPLMGLLAMVITLFLMGFGHAVDVLSLGDFPAYHLGIDPEKTKWIALISASMLTAIAVSISGMIGFVGMFIPHLVRLLVGGGHRLLIPLSALGGATFLMLTDTFLRVSSVGAIVPIGTITAALGAPFFLFLLWRKKSGFSR